MSGKVTTSDGVRESHYWWRSPSGEEYDITSDQYGGDGISPLMRGRKIPPRRSDNAKYALFNARLKALES